MIAFSTALIYLRLPLLRTKTKLGAIGKAGFESCDATSMEDVQRVTAAARAFMGGIDTIVVSAGAGGRATNVAS